MITTARLQLTPVTTQDRALFNELFCRPEIQRYLLADKSDQVQNPQQYLRRKIRHWQHGFGALTVAVKETPTDKIGFVSIESLLNCPSSEQCRVSEICYAILGEYQSQGFAFEAASAALEHVFTQSLADEVFGAVMAENVASRAVLRKLGMQQRGSFDHQATDLITYSLRSPF